MVETSVDKGRLAWWAVGAALAGVTVYVLHSFIGTFVIGVFLYYATRPVYKRIRRHVKIPSLAAAIALVLLALPALLVVSYALAIVLQEVGRASAQVNLGQFEAYIQPYVDISAIVRQPEQILNESNGQVLTEILQQSARYLGFLGTGALHLFVMTSIAFYLLRDDRRLSRWFHGNFGDHAGVLSAFTSAVDRDFNHVFFGNILNAFLTGTIAVLAYSVLNLFAPPSVSIPYAALVGLLAGIASLIPVVGMKLVYVPLAIYLFAIALLQGTPDGLWFPVAFAGISLVIVDTIPDLIIRPYVSGRGLHVGMVMFAYILGPLLFGWYGLFLGPMILVLAVHFARLILPELVSGSELEPYSLDPAVADTVSLNLGVEQPVPDRDVGEDVLGDSTPESD